MRPLETSEQNAGSAINGKVSNGPWPVRPLTRTRKDDGRAYTREPEVEAQFWEVRFWVCLDRRLWNLVEKRQAVADQEVRPGDQAGSDDEDEGSDRLFARIADTGPSAQAKVEQAEALSLLNENERRAVYLCYVEGLPEESEDPTKLSAAKVLGVTGRSIRNYLRRAKDKLQAWEKNSLQA